VLVGRHAVLEALPTCNFERILNEDYHAYMT
jgi:hypothetical protein